MKAIGGFLELELSPGSSSYHTTSLTFKNGRSAFSAVLHRLHARKVYVPFYTCNALLEPLLEGDIQYEFYAVDPSLELATLPTLSKGELLVYVNYFDLKRSYVEQLSERYGDQLVVDATQAFFLRGNGKSWFFNSCRKFFGVPDGSYLYVPERFADDFQPLGQENTSYSVDHLVYRFHGELQLGYESTQHNEALMNARLVAMSRLSRRLLSHVDYASAAMSRRWNFQLLEQRLGALNRLGPRLEPESAPHYFPFLPDELVERRSLWDERIFVPSFWKDCLQRAEPGFQFERMLSSMLLPLPIDQRYTTDDMERVADMVLRSYGAR